MLPSKSVGAPSAFPTVELQHTRTLRTHQRTKRKPPSHAWFPPARACIAPRLVTIFPSFLNLSHVSSTSQTLLSCRLACALLLKIQWKIGTKVCYIWWSTSKFNIVYSRLDIIESSRLCLSWWRLTVQASACTVISSSISWLCNRSFVYQWPRSMGSCHCLHAMHNNEEEEVKKDDLCWVRWRRMTWCVELLCVKKNTMWYSLLHNLLLSSPIQTMNVNTTCDVQIYIMNV